MILDISRQVVIIWEKTGDYFLETAIKNLVEKIKKQYNIEKIYTIGTSKGGWASIYYGIILNAEMIISGAPQYYIADYLNTNEYHRKILKGIVGDNIEQSKVDMLNNKLSNLIRNSDNVGKIKFIIHYSKNEHTYNEHIIYLINDLKKANANIEEDLNSGFKIGHSYFVDKLKTDDLNNSYQNIVKYEIIPLLKEYWIDDEEKVKEYSEML